MTFRPEPNSADLDGCDGCFQLSTVDVGELESEDEIRRVSLCRPCQNEGEFPQ